MPILNVLLRILIIIVVVFLFVTYLAPILIPAVGTLVTWIIHAGLIFTVSFIFHQLGFDLIDWS
jgi:hypothetical protein